MERASILSPIHNLRRLHLAIGGLALILFLVTGQLMRHHVPPMSALGDGVRLLYRSRHIYLLASALVNLMLGLYLQFQSARWRRALQLSGSVFLAASPVLLALAFLEEPAAGFQEEMWRSAFGLYTLFLGSIAHLAAAIRTAP
jgi:hypothetical protein